MSKYNIRDDAEKTRILELSLAELYFRKTTERIKTDVEAAKERERLIRELIEE